MRSTRPVRLAGLSIGLVGFSVYLFVLRGFYAHQDTRTPFVLNVGENLLNIVFAFAARRPLGSARTGTRLLRSRTCCRRSGHSPCCATRCSGFSVRPPLGSMWKMLLAAVLMAEAMWFVTRDSTPTPGGSALGQIVVGGIVGLVVYVVVLLILRTGELEALRRRVVRRTG